MDGISSRISFDKFPDMAEFYGSNAAEYRLEMVKKRKDFLNLFEGATHVDAITYAETPNLMVEMLDENGLDIDTLDVLIGNADDYKENKVDSVPTARSLVELRQNDRLTIRLKNQKTIHSKIYRIVMPDNTVKLVHGSANLSRNSWDNHTNQISIFETDVGTELDRQFEQFIEEYRDRYSNETLLDDLVDAVKNAETDEEQENRIKYWVGAGDLEVSDTGALNQDATADIKDRADEVAAVVDNPEEADKTLGWVDDPEDADHTVLHPDLADEEPEVQSDNPDVGLVESDQETEVSDTLDRPRVKAEDTKIRIGTSQVDKDKAEDFSTSLGNRGATVDDHSIIAPMSAYTNEVKSRTDIPVMSVLANSNQVVIGEDDEMIFVTGNNPSPDILDHCLETIEDYIETVMAHGHTQREEAVMAQMYEAFIYGFWAPFVNEYAEAQASPSRTLSNLLQHLYIVGASDAGKDKLVEYILRLISDNTVVSGVDADEVGVREIRGIRKYDTCFPYALIDAEKEKIETYSPIRNYWDDWTPTSVDQPCLIFTTNDTLPKSEFRNRMKILTMNVRFPSGPDDPGFEAAQDDLAEVLERRNPIFSYVAKQMVRNEPWKDGNGTVEDVRRIFNDFYEIAGRKRPDYFPADQPAEKEYNAGRIMWRRDMRGGRVTFESEPEGIRANFDREDWKVHAYEKRLPKRMLADKSGTSVYIGAPEEFASWFGYSVDDLLNGVDRSNEQTQQTENDPSDDGSSEEEKSSEGFLSRIFR